MEPPAVVICAYRFLVAMSGCWMTEATKSAVTIPERFGLGLRGQG